MPSNKTVKVGASIETAKEKRTQAGVLSVSEMPLPEVAILKEYEKIYPGITQLLLDELCNEGKTRRECAKLMAWSALFAPLSAVVLFGVIGYFCVELAKVNANLGSVALVIAGIALLVSVIKGSLKRFKLEKNGHEVSKKQ